MITSELLNSIFNSFAFVLDIVGIIIIIIGGLIALYKIIAIELLKFKIHKKGAAREESRIELSQRVVLGLEFFLAGDAIRTIISPTWDELGRLSIIVIIRTILNYFLTKEMGKKKRIK